VTSSHKAGDRARAPLVGMLADIAMGIAQNFVLAPALGIST
jgi:hypothetical protein